MLEGFICKWIVRINSFFEMTLQEIISEFLEIIWENLEIISEFREIIVHIDFCLP